MVILFVWGGGGLICVCTTMITSTNIKVTYHIFVYFQFSLYIYVHCTYYLCIDIYHYIFFYMVHLCISLTDLFLPPMVPLFLSLGRLVMEIFRIKKRLLNPYNCILSVLFSTPFKCRKPHAQIINIQCCLLNVRIKKTF